MPSLSAYHLTWVSLTLDVGYLLSAASPDLGHRVSPLVGCGGVQQPLTEVTSVVSNSVTA